MSYCRFSDDSDVYIYSSGDDAFYCHIADRLFRENESIADWLTVADQHRFHSQAEVLAHLIDLRERIPTIRIPAPAISRLEFEAAEGLSGLLDESVQRAAEINRQRWVERN